MADVLIVAAEPSSALYAQRLLEEWRRRGQEVNTFGVGSRAMEALGFTAIGRTEDMAVMGFKEVVAHYPMIRGVFYSLLAEAEKRKPKFALLLDYPDFNLRLAKELKKRGIKVIYYISPQLWAWRKSRIKQVRSFVDKMLVLFPFEKTFYQEQGVDVAFVGHPILDEIHHAAKDMDRSTLRHRIGIQDTDLLLGLMPGSRKSELQHHLDLQMRVAGRLHKKYPGLRFALFVAPGLSIDQVKSQLPDYDFHLVVMQDEPMRMISLSDMILCASGTATLLVGLMRKPMVIMYKMSTFSAWMARTFVKGVSFFGMVNLVLNRKVVPELFQGEANEDNLVAEMSKYIENVAHREKIADELSELRLILGEQGATTRVADALQGDLA